MNNDTNMAVALSSLDTMQKSYIYGTNVSTTSLDGSVSSATTNRAINIMQGINLGVNGADTAAGNIAGVNKDSDSLRVYQAKFGSELLSFTASILNGGATKGVLQKIKGTKNGLTGI